MDTEEARSPIQYHDEKVHSSLPHSIVFVSIVIEPVY